MKDYQGNELLFLGFWKETWQELVDYLKVQQYKDEELIKHMEEVLNGTKK